MRDFIEVCILIAALFLIVQTVATVLGLEPLSTAGAGFIFGWLGMTLWNRIK